MVQTISFLLALAQTEVRELSLVNALPCGVIVGGLNLHVTPPCLVDVSGHCLRSRVIQPRIREAAD
jgi:hypothetical protein